MKRSDTTSGVDQGDAPALLRRSRQRAVKQFHRAAALVPFYRQLLSRHALRPSRVTSIEHFQALVPIINKLDVFCAHPLGDLVVNQSLEDIDTIISSSGVTAQSFSLGMLNRADTRAMLQSTDRLLDHWFDTRHRKTFVINTCAMGVRIPTSLPAVDLSARSDKALAIIQRLGPYFQQFIVTSDVFFLKRLLEDGLAAGIDWQQLHAQFVIGGDWFPESYRSYLAGLLHVDLSCRHPPTYLLSSMGAAELGFNLCHETQETVRLRQLAATDTRLCRALFGDVDTVPMIGHYDPRRWHIELTPTADFSVGDGGAFVFTNVDLRAAMPLVRYESGDCGYLFSRARLSQILGDFAYQGYVPAATLPIMAVAGRTKDPVTAAGTTVRMEFLRSLLYADCAVAALVTGQFQATSAGDRLRWQVQVHAQAGADGIATVQTRLSQMINQHIPADVRAVPYFEFRHGMGIDYERKFTHLVR